MLIYANWWRKSLDCKEPLNGIQSNFPAMSSGFQAENSYQFLSFPVENTHSNPFQLQILLPSDDSSISRSKLTNNASESTTNQH